MLPDPAPHSAATSPPPDGIFDVKTFGAAADGSTLDSPAIQRAIDAAHAAGGGVVHLSAGTYLSASLRLQSRITLSLGPGAVLEAAPYERHPFDPPEPETAPDAQKLSHFGNSHWRNSLISGVGLEDIAIVGPGRIFGKSLVRTPSVPAGAGNKGIALKDCRNVLLRDFSLLQGGHFAILASGTDNLTVDHVTIDTQRDGMDFDGCRNVRISNCSVNSPFDDGICLKSSAALGYARATENVTITNCFVSGYDLGTRLDGTRQRRTDFTRPAPAGATGALAFGPQPGTLANHGGPTGRIKLGTESFGGFKNITISNCVFEYCRGLALEAVDGGILEDITVTNLTLRDVANPPIFLRLGNRPGRGYSQPPVSVVRRVVLSNITASDIDPRLGCLISGIPGHPIEDVTFSNIRLAFRGGGTAYDAACAVEELEAGYPEPFHFRRTPAYGFFLRHLRGVTLHAIDVRTATGDARPPFVLDDVTDIRVSHVTATHAPDVPVFVLKNVLGLTFDHCADVPDLHAASPIERGRLPAIGPPVAARPRVFVVGDSISIDYGPAFERLVAPRFGYDRKRDDATGTSTNLDDPKGANGGDSRMVLEYLRRRRVQNPIAADILLLNCGLHDLRTDPLTGERRVPLDEYAANLRAILAETAPTGLRVVWVRISPVIDRVHNARCQKFHRFAADVDRYNRAADEVMAAAGVPTLDLHAFSLPLVPAAFVDHVHFDEAAREKQAAFLAAGLSALVDSGFLSATVPPPR